MNQILDTGKSVVVGIGGVVVATIISIATLAVALNLLKLVFFS